MNDDEPYEGESPKATKICMELCGHCIFRAGGSPWTACSLLPLSSASLLAGVAADDFQDCFCQASKPERTGALRNGQATNFGNR